MKLDHNEQVAPLCRAVLYTLFDRIDSNWGNVIYYFSRAMAEVDFPSKSEAELIITKEFKQLVMDIHKLPRNVTYATTQ